MLPNRLPIYPSIHLYLEYLSLRLLERRAPLVCVRLLAKLADLCRGAPQRAPLVAPDGEGKGEGYG